jgi:hypothetical protein
MLLRSMPIEYQPQRNSDTRFFYVPDQSICRARACERECNQTVIFAS